MDRILLIIGSLAAGLGAMLGELWLQSAWGAALGGALGPVVVHLLYRRSDS
ncbi:MAG: hypothetical protein ACKODU_12110 [Limnohabitans sp.]